MIADDQTDLQGRDFKHQRQSNTLDMKTFTAQDKETTLPNTDTIPMSTTGEKNRIYMANTQL